MPRPYPATPRVAHRREARLARTCLYWDDRVRLPPANHSIAGDLSVSE